MRISSDAVLYPCSSCGEDKIAREFSFTDEARRLLNSYCRVCQAAYRRAHYLANKPDYIRRAVAQVKGRRAENRREVLAYLKSHSCTDCGIANPIVLEFDHRDRQLKFSEVAKMMVNMRWPRVRAEIEKCDLRCVNCHRRRTARDFAWAKFVSQLE